MSLEVGYDGSSGIERPVGVQHGVLSRVIDLGERDDKFHPGKKKHQVILIWQLSEEYEYEGKKQRFQQTEFATLTLNAKSKLRSFVEGMLGVKIDDMLASVKTKGGSRFKLDLEKLIGKNCMLTLSKKDAKAGEDSYTTVQSVAPLMKGLTPISVQDIPIPEWISEFLGNKEPAKDAADDNVDLSNVMEVI